MYDCQQKGAQVEERHWIPPGPGHCERSISFLRVVRTAHAVCGHLTVRDPRVGPQRLQSDSRSGRETQADESPRTEGHKPGRSRYDRYETMECYDMELWNVVTGMKLWNAMIDMTFLMFLITDPNFYGHAMIDMKLWNVIIGVSSVARMTEHATYDEHLTITYFKYCLMPSL